MYIVKSGKVTWEYHGAAGAKGEISDAALLSTGNILFAHQFGVTLIDADKKVLWNHDAPAKTEIHTAQMIGKDKVLFVQNGAPAKVIVMNITDDKVVTEFEVPVKNPNTVHGHFREGRLTDAGTLLLAHMDLGKVAEYDSKGKEIWANSPGFNIWSARRLPNGNTLILGDVLHPVKGFTTARIKDDSVY